MPALTPAELPAVFRHHLNAGDLAGLMADPYAPDAAYAPVPGVVLTGADLRASVGRLVLDWEIPEAGMAGTATDVGRRGEDGVWRCILDNPHGGAVAVEMPEATGRALAG